MFIHAHLVLPLVATLVGCDLKGGSEGVSVDWNDTGDRWSSDNETNGGTTSGGGESGGEEAGGEETGETGGEETGETGGEETGETGGEETGETGGEETGETGGEETGETGGETGGEETGGEETGGEETGGEDCTDAPLDIWEPNDVDPEPWGDRDGTEFEITGGYLDPATDVDRHTFTVTDGWLDGWDVAFDVQATLTSVPEGVDLRLELWHIYNEDGEAGFGLVSESDEGGPGENEDVSVSAMELTFWVDRGGTYEVRVASADGTSSCLDPYTLTIGADTR